LPHAKVGKDGNKVYFDGLGFSDWANIPCLGQGSKAVVS
jgi:hypothetical protein